MPLPLHLRWASETGHALDLLREFADEAQQRGIAISSAAPLTRDTQFVEGVWVLFVSTTGQGAPPYSMRPLWKEMVRKGYQLGPGVRFAVYSLGDRGYGDNFGLAARKLRQRLKMLGAKELVEIGLGDDQDPQGFREAYLSGWAQQLLQSLELEVEGGQNSAVVVNLRDFQRQSSLELKSVSELSSRNGRRVLWVEMEVQGAVVAEGDVLQIFPHNRKEEVEYMLDHFGKPAEHLVSFLGLQLPLGRVLSEYANISSVLNYYFFSNSRRATLLASAKNQLHRDKLAQFCRDYEEFFHFIVQYKRNIVEFLKDFEIEVDLQYFLAVVGQVVGRKYSVARVQGQRVWLLVKLVETQITESRLYRGLCSHDLLKPGVVRKGRVLRGDIVPEQLAKVNLLVTLGTGIAPFIWVLDRLAHDNAHAMLIYTNSFSDQIFHRKLCPSQNGERLSEVVSCTREGGQKLIRLLESNLERMAEYLKGESLRVFYCGPKEIQEFLSKCVAGVLGVSEAEVQRRKVIVYQNW